MTTTNKSGLPESEISDLFSAMCRGTGEVELFSKSELDEVHVEGGMETGEGEVDGGTGTDTVGETETGSDEVDGGMVGETETGANEVGAGRGTEMGADGGTETGQTR